MTTASMILNHLLTAHKAVMDAKFPQGEYTRFRVELDTAMALVDEMETRCAWQAEMLDRANVFIEGISVRMYDSEDKWAKDYKAGPK